MTKWPQQTTGNLGAPVTGRQSESRSLLGHKSTHLLSRPLQRGYSSTKPSKLQDGKAS